MNLANKYRPRTFEDVSEQRLVVNILENLCKSEKLDNRNFLFIGSAGCGKAQPLTSKVLTPSGFINMGDVKVGTKVFTSGGHIAEVSGVYPQGVRPIYEITLQDRTSIRVSDEHLNVFYRYNETKKVRENYCMTTTDLIDFFETSKSRLRIDLPEIEWEERPVPIDPYLLGALIGDGSLSSNFGFSNSEEDVVEKVDYILRRDWGKKLKKCPGDNVDYSIVSIEESKQKYVFTYDGAEYKGADALKSELVSRGYPKFDSDTLIRLANSSAKYVEARYPELAGAVQCTINTDYVPWTNRDPLRSALDDLQLLCRSEDKHIPEVYLHNSTEVRAQLLRGLYDTDGYTDKSGNTSFSTVSPKLSEGFAFLVRSLGIRDTVSESPSKYKHNGTYVYTGTTQYDHSMKIDNSFDYCSSDKHNQRRTRRQHPPMRNIVSIEYVGDEECQCIMVDHPEHTYISDGFIPTHNTTLARIVGNVLNEGVGEPIEIDAASHNGVDSVRDIVKQAASYPVGSNYKVFILDEVHAFSQQAWQVLLKTLEEGPAKSVFMLCTTNPEKIPATILSRVQTFQLSKISLDGINKRLIHVLECEKSEGRDITYTEDAVNFIAKLANGGMRDALTLLDKALAFSNCVTIEKLSDALNLPNYDDYFDLLQAYAKHDNVNTAIIIDQVYNSGVNFVKWFEGFHAFVMNVVKYIFLQDIQSTMIPSYYSERISRYTSAHSIVCLRLANVLIRLNQDLKSTQYLQEVALTYLCSVSKKGE